MRVLATTDTILPGRTPMWIRLFRWYLKHLNDVIVLPMAIEYPLWDDRSPEVRLRFESPIEARLGRERSASEWTALVEQEMQDTLDRLAEESLRLDQALFSATIAGTAGVGGVYDLGRRLRSWCRGLKFHAEHSSRSSTGAVNGLVTDPSRPEGVRNPE